ncbi:hypothetical protein PFWH6_0023 [Pseudomonas fluorescens WH6]|nr:hypothetical protein PFWH6_0023 [Pseudomonas fluorescens WH6]
MNRATLREASGRRRQMGAQDTTALRFAAVDEDQA